MRCKAEIQEPVRKMRGVNKKGTPEKSSVPSIHCAMRKSN